MPSQRKDTAATGKDATSSTPDKHKTSISEPNGPASIATTDRRSGRWESRMAQNYYNYWICDESKTVLINSFILFCYL